MSGLGDKAELAVPVGISLELDFLDESKAFPQGERWRLEGDSLGMRVSVWEAHYKSQKWAIYARLGGGGFEAWTKRPRTTSALSALSPA